MGGEYPTKLYICTTCGKRQHLAVDEESPKEQEPFVCAECRDKEDGE
jgi:DNA-directed RNA polymerase subunit RPC12/RpoP